MRFFISYRRSDTSHIAGRLFDRLIATCGRQNVFKDVDSIPIGVNFPMAIDKSLSECDVSLVLIGRNWLIAANDRGRRIDDPNDFVRIEIEKSIGKGLQIVPILIEGAPMPAPDELPPSLVLLCSQNAAVLRSDPDFHRDVDRILKAVGISTLAECQSTTSRSRMDENWHRVVDAKLQIRFLSGPSVNKAIPVNRARLLIGRGRDCDIVIADTACSRVGFALEWEWSTRKFHLRSFSRTPILVNNLVIGNEPVPLEIGSTIQVGDSLFMLESAEQSVGHGAADDAVSNG